jgi:hypothetical protein
VVGPSLEGLSITILVVADSTSCIRASGMFCQHLGRCGLSFRQNRELWSG